MALTTDLFTDGHVCAIAQLVSNAQHEVEHVNIQVIVAQISKIDLEFISDWMDWFPKPSRPAVAQTEVRALMEELLGAVLRLVLLRKPDEVTKTAPSDLRINQRRIL